MYILTPKCDKCVIALTILQPVIKQNGHGNKQNDHHVKKKLFIVCILLTSESGDPIHVSQRRVYV